MKISQNTANRVRSYLWYDHKNNRGHDDEQATKRIIEKLTPHLQNELRHEAFGPLM